MTDRARSALKRVCDRLGPQVLLLSWPAGATYLPAGVYSPGPYDVIIGHVAGCPILADLRQLDFYRHHRVLLDASGRTLRTRPILRVRSTATPPAASKGGLP